MAGGLPQQGARADSRLPSSGSSSPGPGREEERVRLVDAVAKAAAEHGYREFTVEQVARYAGVSPAAFYEHFDSREEGLMVAYDAFLNRLRVEVETACEEHDAWPDKVIGALGAVFATLVEASAVARVFAIEVAAAGIPATGRQLDALDDFATLLRRGRDLYPRAAALPEPAERALVGGVASIVSGHLLAEDAASLPALEPQLAELLLTPYLGEEKAKQSAAARTAPG